MTDKEILKGNKLIAEFMEWKKKADNFFESPIHGHYDDNFPNNLHFHESWDWLMPVVDKIENVCNDYGRIGVIKIGGKLYTPISWSYNTKTRSFGEYKESRTNKAYRKIYYYDEENMYGSKKERTRADSKIESVWKCCIYFIKWYNKNVKK